MELSKTFIIEAHTAEEAALKALTGTWNDATKKLICETFCLVVESAQTIVYSAVWNEATTYSDANKTVAYVQCYDKALGLYEAKVTQ